MSTLITFVGDLHSGNVVALMPPTFTLPDGQEVKANRPQKELWRFWLEVRDMIEKPQMVFPQLSRRQKTRKILVVNGDIVEGVHHGNVDLIDTRVDVQESIAIENLEVLTPHVDNLALIAGTQAHSGIGFRSTNTVARNFDTDKFLLRDPERPDDHCWFHIRRSVENVRIDVAHKIGVSKIPWTQITPIRKAIITTIHNCAVEGMPLPHLLIRGHCHRVTDTGFTFAVRGITLGAWTWLSHYARTVAAPEELVAHISALFVYIDGGSYSLEMKQFRLPSRARSWGKL